MFNHNNNSLEYLRNQQDLIISYKIVLHLAFTEITFFMTVLVPIGFSVLFSKEMNRFSHDIVYI